MYQSNHWFIITSDEISEIRRHLQVLEEGGSQKCRDSARVIAKILNTVGQRLA
jgi:hypothetical protein